MNLDDNRPSGPCGMYGMYARRRASDPPQAKARKGYGESSYIRTFRIRLLETYLIRAYIERFLKVVFECSNVFSHPWPARYRYSIKLTASLIHNPGRGHVLSEKRAFQKPAATCRVRIGIEKFR